VYVHYIHMLKADVWICMELMTTCLDKLIKKLQRGIPERILGKITICVLRALNYLKENQGIIHRGYYTNRLIFVSLLVLHIFSL